MQWLSYSQCYNTALVPSACSASAKTCLPQVQGLCPPGVALQTTQRNHSLYTTSPPGRKLGGLQQRCLKALHTRCDAGNGVAPGLYMAGGCSGPAAATQNTFFVADSFTGLSINTQTVCTPPQQQLHMPAPHLKHAAADGYLHSSMTLFSTPISEEAKATSSPSLSAATFSGSLQSMC